MESPDQPASATVIGGKYRVVRKLGGGAMGVVYEATNAWIERRVAIKVLHPERAGDARAAQRLLQEAAAAARIKHPNTVDVLDVDRGADGTVYIVYELLTGMDLRARLDRDRRLAPADALDIAVPVMGALVAAHQRGVVHRDVKPENVFLAQHASGRIVPKVIDFGISKVAAGATPGARVTDAQQVVGTLEYMAPEQLRGDDVDGQADVWSVGAVLYEMLTGHPPFTALSPNLVAARVLAGRAPERVEQLAPRVSRALADVVHRALAHDRAARHRTMRAFLDAVLACPGVDAAGLLRAHPDAVPPLDDAIPYASPDLLEEDGDEPGVVRDTELTRRPADDVDDTRATDLYESARFAPSSVLAGPPLPRGAVSVEVPRYIAPAVPAAPKPAAPAPAARPAAPAVAAPVPRAARRSLPPRTRAVVGAMAAATVAALALLGALGALALRPRRPVIAPSEPVQVPSAAPAKPVAGRR